MSEMMKNSDVEDVLFSIRRLVSDTPEETAAANTDTDAKPKAEALMLTSALRVNDPATEPEQIDLEDMGQDLSHFRDAIGRDEADTNEFPSLDEVFAEKSGDDQPRRLHLSEIVTDDTEKLKPTSVSSVEEYFEDEETGDLAARKWTDDPDVETLSKFATPDDTFGSPVEDIVAETEIEDADAELVAEDWMEDAAADPVTIQEDETLDDEDVPFVEMSAGGNAVDDSEAEVEELEAGATEGLADFDENILDEDALRDMVTEIVREELSGDLGERITRNVRKLVRREIHRALMTRDFD